MGKKFAEEQKMPFKLTSAKNPLSFNQMLEDLVKAYIEKNGGVIESTGGTKLEKKNKKKKDKFC